MFCWCYIDILLVFWGAPLFQGVPLFCWCSLLFCCSLVLCCSAGFQWSIVLCSDVPGFIVHYFLPYFITCKQYLLATLNLMRCPPIDLHDRYILAKMLISANKQSLKKKLCSIRMEWKWKKNNPAYSIFQSHPYDTWN